MSMWRTAVVQQNNVITVVTQFIMPVQLTFSSSSFAGSAPFKWAFPGSPDSLGNSWTQAAGAPVILPPIVNSSMSFSERAQAEIIRRGHPLYGDVTLRLLVEIMNGRLFTTVCLLKLRLRGLLVLLTRLVFVTNHNATSPISINLYLLAAIQHIQLFGS